MESVEQVRIDKWLWAVRLFKSRSLAASACQAGHVKINGDNVKPSRDVRVDEVISVLAGRVRRTVRVAGLLDRRVSAKVAAEFIEDRTPPEEYARAREEALAARMFPHGSGRPTKLERRRIQAILDRPE